jgi:hypothetical protein
VGYLSIWGINNQTVIDNPNIFKGLTHVILSSLVFESNISANFNTSVLSKIVNIIKNVSPILRSLNIKIMLGLGGGNDCAMNGLFANIGLNSSLNRSE